MGAQQRDEAGGRLVVEQQVLVASTYQTSFVLLACCGYFRNPALVGSV